MVNRFYTAAGLDSERDSVINKLIFDIANDIFTLEVGEVISIKCKGERVTWRRVE